MKRLDLRCLTLSVAICLVFGLSPPGIAAGGNGFPEGDHYNLNLIAKKSVPTEPGFFTCPDAAKYQWDYYNNKPEGTCDLDSNGNPNLYCEKCTPDFVENPGDLGGCAIRFPSAQNVIFVPRSSGETVSILVQSGADRPGKKSTIAPSLKVTDWCSETFDRDAAVFQLPENRNGYRVYARVTGKPLPGTAWEFMTPEINLVQDEYGNELLYHFGTIGGALGCTDSAGNILLDRVDPTRKGKGVKQATDLSCLFNFTGEVCYVNDLCYYCEDENQNFTCAPPDPAWIDPDFLCCENRVKNGETIMDSCDPPQPANFACVKPIEECVAAGEIPPNCTESIWSCPASQPWAIDLQCHNYTTPTWVFDIADFVDVLWKGKQGNEEEPEGAYVVQLRFYKN